MNDDRHDFDFVYFKVLNDNPFKHHDCVLLLAVLKAEFRGQFPYLDKLQDLYRE